MGDIVNLRQARKAAARAERRRQAAENAARSGRSRASAEKEAQAAARARELLERHRLERDD